MIIYLKAGCVSINPCSHWWGKIEIEVNEEVAQRLLDNPWYWDRVFRFIKQMYNNLLESWELIKMFPEITGSFKKDWHLVWYELYLIAEKILKAKYFKN